MATRLHTTVGWLERNMGCGEFTEWLAYCQPEQSTPDTMTADQQYASLRKVLG